MVTASRDLDIPVVITAKHSRSQNGSWRLQTFRKWRSLFNFQHARHCFCAYGLRLNGRPFHWKMNSLSLGISIPNAICSEWTDLDTALTAKDAQRLFSGALFLFNRFSTLGQRKSLKVCHRLCFTCPPRRVYGGTERTRIRWEQLYI